jgi:Putative addiction module component
MPIELEIEKMTLEEKLRAMEALWADLTRNEQNIQSPPWHEQVLKEREQRVESGQEKFQSWEDAKRELRDRLT